MFLIYTLEDKIILKPDDLNPKSLNKNLCYEDILLEKVKEKHIGKVILNHGIVVTIKKLILKNNLIVEIEGVINVEVKKI
jgi:DNA-directed RNA polymerase subunit E'/Rpb7